jgi:lysophospholipase L1-like esterase
MRSDAIRAAIAEASARLLGEEKPILPDLPPVGASLPDGMPGHFVPIASPSDTEHGLERFYAALDALAAGEDADGRVRVALYGASGTASDLWTGYVRAYMQARFGDAGPGLVAAARPTKWYRHNDLKVRSSKRHWSKLNAFRMEDGDPGHLGVMGLALIANDDEAWTEVRPRKDSPSAQAVTRLQLFYLAQPGGGTMKVLLGGKLADTIATTAESPEARTATFEVDAPFEVLRIELEGDGEVRLFGVAAESKGPGVVVDSLGVDGQKGIALVKWNQTTWAAGLQARDPDLIAFALGTNESVDEMSDAEYRALYGEAIRRARAIVPRASCLLIPPGDFPIREKGETRPRPRIAEIIAAQRDIAREHGCALWNTREFMGGATSMDLWVEADLAKTDYLHFKRAGYVRLGMGIADALLHRYDWERK